jgi:ABC-type microcin C transport system permease subunit YejE
VKLRTRRERTFRQNVKRAGIWIFLVLFALSIVGGLALITIGSTPAQR